MSSPPSKNASETNNSNNKPKKSAKTNSNAKGGTMDTRGELADLIKKKAETSVINKQGKQGAKTLLINGASIAGATRKSRTTNLCLRGLLPGGYTAVRQHYTRLGTLPHLEQGN